MFVKATTVADYTHLRVEPLTGTIGAEIHGVDLRDLNDDMVSELRDAWLAHKVLFFRDQPFTQAEHVAYGRRYGELEVHPFIDQPVDHPEIVVLDSTPEKPYAAENWHSERISDKPNLLTRSSSFSFQAIA